MDSNVLSKRQLEVFRALCQGKDTGSIAREVNISEQNVYTHLYRIDKKQDEAERLLNLLDASDYDEHRARVNR